MKKNKKRPLFKRCKTILFSVMFLLFSMTSFNAAFSQTKGKLIKVNESNINLNEFVWKVKKLTGYEFVCDANDLSKYDSININKEGTLEEILDEILKDTDLTYYSEDNIYVIKKKAPKVEQPIQQEKKIIKGGVKDKQGVPLPGVSVVIKGTTVGTVTDSNGSYSIEVDNESAVLVFSFVGMESQEIKVGGQTQISVRLEDATSELGEIVVTGYQEVKKERITGSVETIEIGDIADKPYASVDQLLAGKVSGVASFMSSGQAGKTADINIRGINTISGSTQPLWIVDGLPLQGESPSITGGTGLEADILNNGVGNIPSSDIKTITVLKDAAAAAIYGARAANGVIIITTKSGSQGEIYANFDASISFSEAPSLDLDFMNSAEKIEYERGLFEDYYGMERNLGGAAYRILHDVEEGKLSQVQGNSLLNDLSKNNTNWFDEIFRNSVSKSYGFNISGGSKKVTYYFSVNRTEEEGILRNDNYDNTSVRAKGTFKPNDKLEIVFGVNSTIKNKKYHASNIDPFKYAVYANPYEKPYNDDGTYAYDNTYLNLPYKAGLEVPVYGTFNILNEIENTASNSKYTSTSTYANLHYNILDELKFSSKFVKTNTQKDNERYANPGTYASYLRSYYKSALSRSLEEEENLGYFQETAVFSEEYSFNNTLEYSKEFDNKLYVNALIGQEISATKTNDFYTFLPEYYPEYDLIGYPDLEGIDGEKISLSNFGGKGFRENRYSSFFSSFTIGYDDKYILNFNARYDGADIIGDAERFTPLWSASARWNIHKEDFFRNVSLIDELYLKGEYGFTGNINREAYPFTTITLSGTNRYLEELVAESYTYPNPAIKWEEKEEKSFGVGASMFNYRFNFNFNYYHNYVSDVLNRKQLPASAGVTQLTANVSNLLNEGYELSCNFVPVKGKDFLLTLNFNGSYNKNEVSNAFYSNLNEVNLNSVRSVIEFPQVSGYALNTVFGLIDKGVNPATGLRMVEVRRPEVNSDGYVKETIARRDVDMDNDRAVKLGQLNPKYTGGFGLSASYKNWDLNTNFTFEAGHIIPKFSERLSSPVNSINPTRYSRLNVLNNKSNRWRQPGDITNVESFDDITTSTSISLDTDFEKGDYIKMKSLILSYRMPADILKKANVGIKRLKMSIQADNLFTITEYSGIDPETRNNFGYPVSRTYRFALNFGF